MSVRIQSFPSLSLPAEVISALPPSSAAIILSGTILAKAPITAFAVRYAARALAATAAGALGLSTVPSGTNIRMGRVKPELWGRSADIAERTARKHAALVKVAGVLIAPRTWGAV